MLRLFLGLCVMTSGCAISNDDVPVLTTDVETTFFDVDGATQLGIRIKSIRSGMIPVPIAAVANQITAQAKRSGFDIQWKNEGSDTVAIIDLPDAMIKPNDGGSYIELETLEIVKGRISIGGVTHPPDF